MIRIAFVILLLLSLTWVASPAFCKDKGSYQDYLLQVPGLDQGEMNCAAQPANQYYNPVQQQQPQQFNQIVSPTQVSQDYPSGGQGYDGNSGGQQNSGNQGMPGQNASAYQQQEMALQQSQMAQQLEDVKKSQESAESFRGSSQFNDKSNDKSTKDQNDKTKKNKAQGVASSMGRMVNRSLRYATPAAGTLASVFLLRAAFGGSMMAMPMGGGMGGGMMMVGH